MAKGEVIIKEADCRGCGYCAEFCPQKCLLISGKKFSVQGYVLPEVTEPERCTACGFCVWMCPHYAIEVYKFVPARTGRAG